MEPIKVPLTKEFTEFGLTTSISFTRLKRIPEEQYVMRDRTIIGFVIMGYGIDINLVTNME